MYNTHHRGYQQPDKGGSAQARPDGSRSSQSLGGQPSNAGELGAGAQHAERPRAVDNPHNPGNRAFGGQADLGFFGVPSGLPRQAQVKASAQGQEGQRRASQASAQPQALRVAAPAPYRTFSQHRAVIDGYRNRPLPVRPAGATVAAPERIPAPAPKPLRVNVPADYFKALGRIADNKLVGLDELVADLLIRCVKRIHERESAMQANAAAADERERFAPEPLEEWGRPVLFGHTEIELAMVG